MKRALALVTLATTIAGLGGLQACSPEVQEKLVMREPTADELLKLCTPEVQATTDALSVAQTRVATLERDVASKEGQVRDLEARIQKNQQAGQQFRAEYERLKAELADTKQKLAVAEEEKSRLLVELTNTKQELASTQEALVVAEDQRDQAKEDALYNRYQEFVASAQLEICDKGNRKKLGGCREAVTETLTTDARRDRFAHCIRSGQAQPMVHELLKDATLPQYAEMMNEELKQVKGWYVEFCDPTLPERADAPLAGGQIPKATGG